MRLLAISAVCAIVVGACLLDRDGQLELTAAGSGGETSTAGSGGVGNLGGAGGSGGSTSSSMGGIGGAPPEMCASGFECVPVIDAGAYVRTPTAACSGDWQSATPYAPPVQPGCDGCSCGAPTPGTCSPGQLIAWSDDVCGSLLGQAPGTNCMNLPGSHDSFRLSPSTPSASTCPPSGGGTPPIDERTVCTLTTAPAASCGDGWVCVPEGMGGICQILPAGGTCAAGFGNPVDLAPVTGDTRDCTCRCGPSTGQDCNASATVHSSNGCSSPIDTVPDDNQCTDTIDSSGSIFYDVGTWSGGSCAPEPTTGSVSFGATETLCCR